MTVYLVTENCWGTDWERYDNLMIFEDLKDAESYVEYCDSEPLPQSESGREFNIEELDFVPGKKEK